MGGCNRRTIIKGALGALAACGASRRATYARAAPTVSLPPRRPLDFRPFAEALSGLTPEKRCRLDVFVLEATAPQLQADFAAGRYSASDLVAYYVDRIRRLDAIHLRSVIELNPEALDIAARLDSERSTGRVRGALHGVPILLKDNIGTGDRLHTTAGAAALSTAHSDRDAHLVTGLRGAGAIILGKTNLSEWSYWMSYVAPSGFSALGGQVVSPYGPGIDPFGSSTGSAVAVTMNLAAITVGTETAGSIVAPSARASVVGMRPSLGLVSRDRVVPITDECDTAGPIGRTVTDVAAALTAMTRTRDIRDRHSDRAEGVHGTDFMGALDPEALRGKRIGLIGIGLTGPADDEWIIANSGLTNVVQAMMTAGAKVVVIRPAPFDFEGPGFVPEFNWGLREGVNAYLAATDAPARTLADVIAFNDENPGRYAPWGQDRLRDCLWSPLGEQEARQISRSNRQQARDYLTGLLDADELDVLVGIDTLQSLIYPFAGFPAIAVPAGLYPGGAPFSVTFIGRSRADAELIGIAYAYEQASRLRVPPALEGAAQQCPPTSQGQRRSGATSWWGFSPA
ncbi:MAG TPA: amidase family protein [Thermomicrobiales bacterium]|nr:amidase family protein [Thermomicrobiales bacterium]